MQWFLLFFSILLGQIVPVPSIGVVSYSNGHRVPSTLFRPPKRSRYLIEGEEVVLSSESLVADRAHRINMMLTVEWERPFGTHRDYIIITPLEYTS